MLLIPPNKQVEFLIRRRFPEAKLVGIPLKHSDPRLNGISDTTIEKIKQYETELTALKPVELFRLFQAENKKHLLEQSIKAAIAEQQRFFKQPSADADFDHWSKTAYWSIDEATALSLGKDPHLVSWSTINKDHSPSTSPFVNKYRKLRDLALTGC